MYGLETLHLTQAMSNKLDAFQMRGLRRILQRQSTFIDRRNTNSRLLEEATAIAFPTPGDNRKICRFSEFHMQRRAKLLGHILRSSNTDPLRQVSCEPNTANRVDYGRKRVGKPRQNWLHHTKKYIYENILNGHNYEESKLEDNRVYAAATRRTF